MDSEYFKNYYLNNKQKYTNKKMDCEYCKKSVFCSVIKKHQLTPKCQLARLQNQPQKPTVDLPDLTLDK